MKKLYISPEFEKLKIDLNTVICSSLNAETPETPIDEIIAIYNDDDVSVREKISDKLCAECWLRGSHHLRSKTPGAKNTKVGKTDTVSL